jgi:hypothetical protein
MRETGVMQKMLWSLVKSWAKNQGYETLKDKGNEEKGDRVQYYWSKINDPQSSGVEPSVSKLATAIFNNLTDNQWVDHQVEFKKNKEVNKFSIDNYGS